MEKDATKTVIKTLKAYLHEELPPNKDFFKQLDSRGLLASNSTSELAQLADQGKQDCVWKLVTYMEQFYTEEMLLRLCNFLEEYAQPARLKLVTIASKIRQEILEHKPQVALSVLEDTLHRSAGVCDVVEVLYPVITPLKQQFSELVAKVFVVISKLKGERMEELHSYLTTLLTPSGGQGMPRHVRHAKPPIVPKPVDELKEFLRVRWDELNIKVLESIVKHLKDDKLTRMMMHYNQTLSKEDSKPLSKVPVDTVQPNVAPEETLVRVKIDRSPDQQTLGDVFSLRNLIHSLGRRIRAMFRGFLPGSTVLFFSIPTECVWSLPSCLLPSNLSLLEEWKVLFLSVKGAFTVDIKERRVIDSLDKHSLLSSLAEDKTLIEDLRTKVQQLQKEKYLHFKKEELRAVMETEVKVSRKWKDKAAITDQEIEEKVSFEEKPVAVKTELPPYLDIKAETSPDVSLEPSSKRFKTGPDSLAYEPPLEKKSEEKEKDTQIAKLLEEIQRLKQERNNLLHQMSFIAEQPASSISPAKPFKPEQNNLKVFRSDLVRPGEHRSVKMADLLIPTHRATPVTIGRDVYLAGGVTGEVKTDKLVLVYNMDSGDCRTLPPSPQYNSEAVAIDSTLVLIGGCDSSTDMPTNMMSTWMAAEERWTQDLPPMKMKRHRPGVLLLNKHLFVFGGMDEDGETRLDSFEALDLNIKQWSEGRGGLPRPLHSPQLGVFGDYVMLYGGYASAGAASRACYKVPVQVLVDSGDSNNLRSPPLNWTPVQAAPYYSSSLLTTSQDAVLIGGERDRQATRAIHRFSSSGYWEVIMIGELSEPQSRPAVVAVSDRSFLVLGGYSDPKNVFSSLLKSVEIISY